MFLLKIKLFLKEIFNFKKKKNLFWLILVIATWGINFYLSPYFLAFLQKNLGQKLIFFSVTEPFIALLKFSLLITFVLFFPLLWYLFFIFLNFLFYLPRKTFFLFFILGLILFYLGIFFAFKVSLPYGIQFLLSFKTEKLEPAISLGHFVNFFSFFLIAFGFFFELPLLICLLSLTKLLNPYRLSYYRKEVFLAIVVLSAIITPTPDAFNMMLLAFPLYLLFELGLFLSKRLVKK